MTGVDPKGFKNEIIEPMNKEVIKMSEENETEKPEEEKSEEDKE